MIRKMILGTAVAVALTMGSSQAASFDAPVDTSSVITATRASFPATIALPRGFALTFVNADPIWDHGIVSVDTLKGSPLFGTASDSIAFGGTAAVLGVEDLAPGYYEFYSPLHEGVRGALRVF